jgi:hypothetical protein
MMQRSYPLTVPSIALCLLLGACHKAADVETDVAPAATDVAAPAPPGPQSTPVKANLPHAQGASAAKPTEPAPAPQTPQLAYSYTYAVEAPADRLRDLEARTRNACLAAGVQACQLTSETVNAQAHDTATAELKFRATPAWLSDFGDRLAKDAASANGKLVSSQTSTEDLTRQVIDTDAAVRAKTALRDRLQQLLETRPGKLDDLVALEQQVAAAQQDLDATTSELAAMRDRIAMSDVDISYDSVGGFGPRSAWSPLGMALGGLAGAFAGSLAALIVVVTWISPWLAALLAGLWLARRLKLFTRAAAPAGETAPVKGPDQG